MRRLICLGSNCSMLSSPAAPTNSIRLVTVSRWKFATRSALLVTTMALFLDGFCVAIPVGQWSVLQVLACIQPSDNMKLRAELTASAPKANARTIWNAENIFPDAIILTLSRTPIPSKALFTNIKASRIGVPTEFVISVGAAPVPPSPPSTVIKSGVIPVSTIALHIAKNSSFRPIQSLKPIGLPSDNSRSSFTNNNSSLGVEKALWDGGDITSAPIGTCLILDISSVTFAAGKIPPCPGFAPWDNFISIILTTSLEAFSRKVSGLKLPLSSRQPKYPVPICQTISPPYFKW